MAATGSYALRLRDEVLAKKFDRDVLASSLISDQARRRAVYKCGSAFSTQADLQQTLLGESGLASRVGVLQGDVTTLEIDAVVNAANETLMGGGGIDGAIHAAAGPLLQFECAALMAAGDPVSCAAGQTVVTRGYKLPANYVLHTVAPYLDAREQPQPALMRSCYRTIMQQCLSHGLRTVAIPAIGTGFYGYPKAEAARLGADVVLAWMAERSLPAQVYFVGFTAEDTEIMRTALAAALAAAAPHAPSAGAAAEAPPAYSAV